MALLRKACWDNWGLGSIWDLQYSHAQWTGGLFTVPRLLGHTAGIMLKRAFFLGVWNFGTCQAEGVYTASNKNSACWVSHGLHRGCCLFMAEGGACCVWSSWEGKSRKKPARGSLQNAPRSVPWLSRYVSYYITIMHLSCDCNDKLSPRESS